MNKTYKRRVIFAASALVALFLVIIGLSYFLDPCNIYRPANRWKLCGYRHLNAGFINYYLHSSRNQDNPYNSIVIGSSVSQNFLTDDIEKYLGFDNVLPLFIAGYEVGELDMTIRHALRSGRVKKVLWGIDHYKYDITDPTKAFLEDSVFPRYLYDESWLNDMQYLTSYDTVSKLPRAFVFRVGHAIRKKLGLTKNTGSYINIDKIQYWGNDPSLTENAIIFNGPKDLKRLKDNMQPFNIEDPSRLGLDYVFNVVRSYPDVEFILFFPPYPLTTIFDTPKYMGLKREIVKNLSGMSHVKIYDFTSVFPIVSNIANYKDPVHTNQHINKSLLMMMGKGKGLLTVDNFDSRMAAVKKFYSTYTPYSDYDAIMNKKRVLVDEKPRTYSADASGVIRINISNVNATGKLFILKMDVETPADGQLTLIGWPANNPVYPLRKGLNKVYIPFELPEKIDPLTIEIAAGEGSYAVGRILITEAKTDF